jgi:hypothetical protein
MRYPRRPAGLLALLLLSSLLPLLLLSLPTTATSIPVDGCPRRSISCGLCDTVKDYMVSTQGIRVNGPPAPGVAVEIVATGELRGEEPVRLGAIVAMEVFMGPMLVMKKRFDLCRLAAEVGVGLGVALVALVSWVASRLTVGCIRPPPTTHSKDPRARWSRASKRSTSPSPSPAMRPW